MVRLIAALALACVAGQSAAQEEQGVIASRDVDELSGLVVSHADPSILWGHNDSGDGPNLYRIGLHGEDLGKITVKHAQAGDWEDIAAFDDASGPALLVADTGDDLGLRAYSTLYAVRDPGRGDDATLLWRLDFDFPDGEHDTEAVAVDPLTKEILLLTKRDRPARLYRLPLPDRTPAKRQTAEFVGELALFPTTPGQRVPRFFQSPTALDISRDGLTAAIVTPFTAYVYRRRPDEAWLALFQHAVPGITLPRLPQTEAAALTPDAQALYIGSEGKPGRWARIDLPPEITAPTARRFSGAMHPAPAAGR